MVNGNGQSTLMVLMKIMMFEVRYSTRLALLACLLVTITRNVEGTAVHVPSSANHNGGQVSKKSTSRTAQPLTMNDNNSNNNNVLVRGGASSVEINPSKMRRYADDNRMPSLFLPEESLCDRYAACLAGTEGLRRIRDRDLADEATKDHNSFRRDPDGDQLTEVEREITAQYVQNSKKVLRALGMTVNQFNEIGRQVAQDGKLREKVMEQAYLYRMAATVSMDRMPVIDDPNSSALIQAFRRDKVHLFCESMSEIEQFRANQIERLTKAVGVDKFPGNVNISDPGLLPFLSPKVRAVVEAFPLQAEEIIKKHGLQSEEFNKMLEETKTNPLFRWKIRKELKQSLIQDADRNNINQNSNRNNIKSNSGSRNHR